MEKVEMLSREEDFEAMLDRLNIVIENDDMVTVNYESAESVVRVVLPLCEFDPSEMRELKLFVNALSIGMRIQKEEILELITIMEESKEATRAGGVQ